MNKYYLFISYSRADSKAAAYLQRQLEHFRIPVKQVPPELLPGGQKFLRPVFRDRRDLKTSEKSFTNDIKAALEDSRYLLVLCSPNSADSIWVNEEVKHFLAVHGSDFSKIVPVILEGRPGHGGNVECLPPELRREEITSRNLPSMIPDDGEPVKAGWENGVVQSLSYMLKVDREKIKASVDREKLRWARINAAVGACAAVVFAALTVWAIRAERIADRNEKRANENAELARKNEAKAKTNEKRALAGEKLAKENEAKAKAQAEIARKSLDFLGEMFRSADPTERGSRDVKVLDAIKAKLPKVPKLTPWQLRASVSRDIATILHNLGEYDTADQLLWDALKLYETNAPQSLDAAICYNNLGNVCYRQGKLNDAVKCYEKALKIWVKALGENHPFVATTYNNLGNIYRNQGKYDDAIRYFKKALAIRRKALGENHPDTATYYNNLGSAYYNQGKFDDAIKSLKKALEIILKVQGENHPNTAINYNNLGEIYRGQGKFDAAVKYYKKALAIWVKVLGENHPYVATTYNNLGLVYYDQGNSDDAIRYHKKALKIRLKVLGENTPDVAQSYNNLGSAYWKSGDTAKAVEYTTRAVAIAKKTLGKDHPNTKQFRENLEYIRNQMGK